MNFVCLILCNPSKLHLPRLSLKKWSGYRFLFMSNIAAKFKFCLWILFRRKHWNIVGHEKDVGPLKFLLFPFLYTHKLHSITLTTKSHQSIITVVGFKAWNTPTKILSHLGMLSIYQMSIYFQHRLIKYRPILLICSLFSS